MTGIVTWEVLGWIVGGLVGALAVSAAVIGFFFKALAIRDLRIAALEDGLQAHRLHTAETFATKQGVTEAVGRVEHAVDRLIGRVDNLVQAIASANPGAPPTAPPPRSRSL